MGRNRHQHRCNSLAKVKSILQVMSSKCDSGYGGLKYTTGNARFWSAGNSRGSKQLTFRKVQVKQRNVKQQCTHLENTEY